MNRVFITGAGIISALGVNKTEVLESLRKHRSGIAPLIYLNTLHRGIPAGEVKRSNREMMQMLGMPPEEITTRTSLLGMIAVDEALQQAGLETDAGMRLALVSGTTVGGMDMSEQYYKDFLENDTRNAYIATHDCGACTEMIANRTGMFSMLDTISTACSSAANAIMLGAKLILHQRADAVVAGGCECITRFHLNGFNSFLILDGEACKPFDEHRAGLNLGEGAAYVVLESGESLRRRNREPLCRLSGWGNACDAFHQTASSPRGEGAVLSMTKALASASLSPSEISYVNAHGTGTQNNDLSEGIALERVFGKVPPVSSTKSFTGHTTSAAGGVEAVISLLALQHNFIPVNLNFSSPMKELSFRPSTHDIPAFPLRHILSNSFGFGGNNTSLIFSKAEDS
ncbi:MAG: beta-ketoacyl-[acyl-carrier-protein] synthase family protein [Tannerellaceae bacterium]|jgi:3-oxoacyl-[acyl-carrier-protein] synthase-1|nr:beta-ketoacyl-[acyl-carrier-protein] synthase family protein [Tannerellaceae bacterium]